MFIINFIINFKKLKNDFPFFLIWLKVIKTTLRATTEKCNN